MNANLEVHFLEEMLFQARCVNISVQRISDNNTSTVEFFKELHSLLGHLAMVSKILWPPDQKKYKTRGEHLCAVLGINEDSTSLFRKLRNCLEHFDEHLHEWWESSPNHTYIDHCIIPTRLMGKMGSARKEDFVRSFDPETKVFTFRGTDFDIQEIIDKASAIIDAAEKRLALHRALRCKNAT